MCNRGLIVVLTAVFWGPPSWAQFNGTGTTTLSLSVAPAAAIRIDTGTTTLSTVGTAFSAYTGTTNFTYKFRTGAGGGSITLEVTADFSPAGGPSVATDALTYTCTAASGTACSSAQTASTGAGTPVVTLGANAHSSSTGDAGSTDWSLPNDPRFAPGTYSATVTYTIAAT